MNEVNAHPGRSPEFLSRLHDGDLPPAERAQFESHRAHCGECRGAAAQFEAALALFRSNRPRPPAPDLSARILRKLQAASPRRSPLGVTFGIDLRWAGAFAAALVAVIIGSEVVVRREAAERRLASPQAPIPITMQEQPRSSAGSRGESAAKNEENDRRLAPAPAGDAPVDAGRPQNIPKGSETSKSRNQVASAPALPQEKQLDKETSRKDEDEGQRASASSESKPQPPSAARAHVQARVKTESGSFGQLQERAGGDGGATSKLATDSLSAALRLELTAVDGGGPVPALANGDSVDLPAELKGREFVLVVEASGQVREVRPAEQGLHKKGLRQEPGREAQVSDEKGPPALLALRFHPGDRPRLLRARVE